MSTQTTTEFSHCCAAHLQLDFHFHFHFHFHIAIFAWASHSQAGRQGVCLVVPVPDQTRGKSVFPGDADADACDKSASGHYISLLNKLRSAKMTPSLSTPLSLFSSLSLVCLPNIVWQLLPAAANNNWQLDWLVLMPSGSTLCFIFICFICCSWLLQTFLAAFKRFLLATCRCRCHSRCSGCCRFEIVLCGAIFMTGPRFNAGAN